MAVLRVERRGWERNWLTANAKATAGSFDFAQDRLFDLEAKEPPSLRMTISFGLFSKRGG
jgi:hypothetical protein